MRALQPARLQRVAKRVSVALDPARDYSTLRVGELKAILASKGERCALCVEKSDFVRKVHELSGRAAAQAAAQAGGEL